VDEAEFDRFADEYRQMHAANIRLSGEAPEYFADYKIVDVARLLRESFGDGAPKILDFGAGVGTSVPFFRRHIPQCSLTCIDVSRKSLELGSSRFGGKAEFVHFDGTHIPFPDGYFDLVFLACVLHHIPHSEHLSILTELCRVMRRSGLIVVVEHNPYNPLTVHAVNTCPFDENAVLLKPDQLRRSIAGVGFGRPSIRYRIFFPHVLRALRVLEPWMTWLPLGAQYSVHARKS
jgi:SAM-dependent methyltransferase